MLGGKMVVGADNTALEEGEHAFNRVRVYDTALPLLGAVLHRAVSLALRSDLSIGRPPVRHHVGARVHVLVHELTDGLGGRALSCPEPDTAAPLGSAEDHGFVGAVVEPGASTTATTDALHATQVCFVDFHDTAKWLIPERVL